MLGTGRRDLRGPETSFPDDYCYCSDILISARAAVIRIRPTDLERYIATHRHG